VQRLRSVNRKPCSRSRRSSPYASACDPTVASVKGSRRFQQLVAEKWRVLLSNEAGPFAGRICATRHF